MEHRGGLNPVTHAHPPHSFSACPAGRFRRTGNVIVVVARDRLQPVGPKRCVLGMMSVGLGLLRVFARSFRCHGQARLLISNEFSLNDKLKGQRPAETRRWE